MNYNAIYKYAKNIFLAFSILLGVFKFYDELANGAKLINLWNVLWLSVLCFFLILIFNFLLKRRIISVGSENVGKFKLSKINGNYYRVLIISFTILWLIAFFNYFTSITEKKSDKSFDKVSSLKKKKNILILPFLKLCEYNGKSYDIGLVLKYRLDSIIVAENLNFETNYILDSIDFKNLNDSQIDSMISYHSSSMAICGWYSYPECEDGNLGKICYRFRLAKDLLTTNESKYQDKTNLTELAGLLDVRSGKGQIVDSCPC